MKKLMVLAVVAALTAMALPTFASAFKDKGVSLTESKTVPGKGTAAFTGGTSCTETTGTIDLGPGKAGSVTSFTVDNPESCTVTGTLKSLGCTALASETSTGFPWALDDNGTNATITGVDIDNVYTGGAFCPKNLTLSGNLTATPDNVNAIKKLTLSGTLKSSVAGISSEVSGELVPVEEKDLGTYGLG